MLQTEFNFTLPQGYVDDSGSLHREGKMRLATAMDEMLPLRDSRVKENPEYLIILILSRVVVSLGALAEIDEKVMEKLFVADLTYLQELYNQINQAEKLIFEGNCPECGKTVKIPVNFQQAGR